MEQFLFAISENVYCSDVSVEIIKRFGDGRERECFISVVVDWEA